MPRHAGTFQGTYQGSSSSGAAGFIVVAVGLCLLGAAWLYAQAQESAAVKAAAAAREAEALARAAEASARMGAAAGPGWVPYAMGALGLLVACGICALVYRVVGMLRAEQEASPFVASTGRVGRGPTTVDVIDVTPARAALPASTSRPTPMQEARMRREGARR